MNLLARKILVVRKILLVVTKYWGLRCVTRSKQDSSRLVAGWAKHRVAICLEGRYPACTVQHPPHSDTGDPRVRDEESRGRRDRCRDSQGKPSVQCTGHCCAAWAPVLCTSTVQMYYNDPIQCECSTAGPQEAKHEDGLGACTGSLAVLEGSGLEAGDQQEANNPLARVGVAALASGSASCRSLLSALHRVSVTHVQDYKKRRFPVTSKYRHIYGVLNVDETKN
jgi:hypothetical protein